MKNRLASAIPISTARGEVEHHGDEEGAEHDGAVVERQARAGGAKACHSPMLIDTMTTMADSVASGMWSRRAKARAPSRAAYAEWIMPAIGVRPPVRMLVAVRAIAPVAAKLPKAARRRWRRPAPSALVGVVAHRRSGCRRRAPGAATRSRPGSAIVIAVGDQLAERGQARPGRPKAEFPADAAKRLPMVSTGSAIRGVDRGQDDQHRERAGGGGASTRSSPPGGSTPPGIASDTSATATVGRCRVSGVRSAPRSWRRNRPAGRRSAGRGSP